MENTEEIQESKQYACASKIFAFYNAKMDLKAAEKASREQEKEAIETEEYLELKAQIKELNSQLKEMKEEALDGLADDENHVALRKKVLELEEELSHQRELVATSLDELPSEPVQLCLNFGDDGESMVTITSKKHLFIGGEDQKI
jgi:hypothetical protein